MSAKNKKGLGRSFESLIPTNLFDESFDPTANQDEKVSDLRSIKLASISADPHQPRHHFDETALDELAASIKQHGILQPLVVTPHGDGYQIVAGERRFRAAKQAGLTSVPVIIRTLSDQHKLELALIENLQRRDLNALETATAYAKLRDQFNLTLEEIGIHVGGKSVSAISNTLRLLKLPKKVQKIVAEGGLTEGQARPLIGLDDSILDNLLPKIVRDNLSARAVEQLVASYRQPSPRPTTQAAKESAYKSVSLQLTKRFGTAVRVTSTKKGAGQVIIPFKNADELEKLKKKLG